MTKPDDQNHDVGLDQRVHVNNVTAFVPRPRQDPARGQPPRAQPEPDNDDPGPSAA